MGLVSQESDAGRDPRDTVVGDRNPRWVTEELIADTISTWQPYYATRLTDDDALEILRSVGDLIDVLELTP